MPERERAAFSRMPQHGVDDPDFGVAKEVERQDEKHGAFSADTELGQLRLGLACLQDEVDEALQAWRDERKVEGWPHTLEEVCQVAAIATRILRQFND